MSQKHLSSFHAHQKTSIIQTLFVLSGVIAPLLVVLVYTFDGFLRPGYSPVRQPISDLGRGAHAWIFAVDFVVFGVLLALFALGFPRAIGSVLKRRWVNVSTFFLLIDKPGCNQRWPVR